MEIDYKQNNFFRTYHRTKLELKIFRERLDLLREDKRRYDEAVGKYGENDVNIKSFLEVNRSGRIDVLINLIESSITDREKALDHMNQFIAEAREVLKDDDIQLKIFEAGWVNNNKNHMIAETMSYAEGSVKKMKNKIYREIGEKW